MIGDGETSFFSFSALSSPSPPPFENGLASYVKRPPLRGSETAETATPFEKPLHSKATADSIIILEVLDDRQTNPTTPT